MSARRQLARRIETFATEADLCSAFLEEVAERGGWTAYAETAGFDILLSRDSDGVQVGIEAKLVFNTKVLCQALPKGLTWNYGDVGPDYRAVLIPYISGSGLDRIAGALGIAVIRFRRSTPLVRYGSYLPNEASESDWHQWAPLRRCALPGYVPDVRAGASAPVALTTWKVRAIKLAIILEQRPVTRADFRSLGLSPSRWTDPYTGWLKLTPEGYIAGPSIPDFRAQHPRNYEEIRTDFEVWAPKTVPVTVQKALAI